MREHIIYFVLLVMLCSCKYSKHNEWQSEGELYKINYTGDTNKEFEGDIKVYYPSGELHVTYKLKNNFKEGYERQYYKTGGLHRELYFVHGIQEGLYREFYENGKLRGETGFSNNKPNGFDISYYRNGRVSRYEIWFDSLVLYGIGFDTNGKEINTNYNYYIKAPSSIGLGEQFKAEIKIPVCVFDSVPDFNIGIQRKNIYSDTTTSKYNFIAEVENKHWVYSIATREPYFDRSNKQNLINIPISDKGIGIFKYEPTSIGTYLFKGCVSMIAEKRAKDSVYYSRQLNIKFTVTK